MVIFHVTLIEKYLIVKTNQRSWIIFNFLFCKLLINLYQSLVRKLQFLQYENTRLNIPQHCFSQLKRFKQDHVSSSKFDFLTMSDEILYDDFHLPFVPITNSHKTWVQFHFYLEKKTWLIIPNYETIQLVHKKQCKRPIKSLFAMRGSLLYCSLSST